MYLCLCTYEQNEYSDIWIENDQVELPQGFALHSPFSNDTQSVHENQGYMNGESIESTEISLPQPIESVVSDMSSVDSAQSNNSTLTENVAVIPEDEWSDASTNSTRHMKQKRIPGKVGRRTWTKDEDVMLCKLVIKYNQKHWKYNAKGNAYT